MAEVMDVHEAGARVVGDVVRDMRIKSNSKILVVKVSVVQKHFGNEKIIIDRDFLYNAA